MTLTMPPEIVAFLKNSGNASLLAELATRLAMRRIPGTPREVLQALEAFVAMDSGLGIGERQGGGFPQIARLEVLQRTPSVGNGKLETSQKCPRT